MDLRFLDDTPYAIINVYFDRIADKIHEHVLRGGRSLVHCVLGVSRSTSLVNLHYFFMNNIN
jgi:protein-tyrosine phosphatase